MAGVVPRMAQELIRHSDIRLAVETLPSIGMARRELGRQFVTGLIGRSHDRLVWSGDSSEAREGGAR